MSSFITTNATQDVFELVLARPAILPTGEHPWLVQLWWRAPQQGDRLVQVYVQDELYDVSLHTASREMTLILDRTRANRIELLAVPADDREAVWRPQPDLLGSWQPRVSDVAGVSLVRDEALPVETRVDIEVDGVLIDSRMMWPNHVNRSDLDENVMAVDVAGLGLGVGNLGAGRLGYDGASLCWRRDDLQPGTHDFLAKALDGDGRSVADPLQLENIVIDGLPDPVVGLSVDQSFRITWD